LISFLLVTQADRTAKFHKFERHGRSQLFGSGDFAFGGSSCQDIGSRQPLGAFFSGSGTSPLWVNLGPRMYLIDQAAPAYLGEICALDDGAGSWGKAA